MNAADILTLLDPATPDTWPQGILAAADLREQRARAGGVPEGPYFIEEEDERTFHVLATALASPFGDWDIARDLASPALAEHIASEANPLHTFASIELWRAVAGWAQEGLGTCSEIEHTNYPDAWADVIVAVAAEARAYLGGAL